MINPTIKSNIYRLDLATTKYLLEAITSLNEDIFGKEMQKIREKLFNHLQKLKS